MSAVAASPAETRFPTPFAVLGIVTDGAAVTAVTYLPPRTAPRDPQDRVAESACREVERYLADPAYVFRLPYRLEGTVFQHRVWREIAKLFPLKTITYGELARKIGSAPRAVGGACGTNPVPLFVPCHRVLSAGGGLGGFMGGKDNFPLSVKRWLLRHEGIVVAAD